MQQTTTNYPKQSEYPDWHYQPIRLLKAEMETPLEVIREFFSGYTLPQARKHVREMLEDAMCNVEMYSINYLTLYDNIEKLIEAAWLIKQNGVDKAQSPFSPGAGISQASLVHLLASTIRPERIFLLSAGEDEAVDLLIVVPENTGKPFSHYSTLIEAVSCGINISFSLHLSSSFHKHIEEAHPFWVSCCTEDRQIYTSVNTPFPPPCPEKRAALAERMQITFLSAMSKSNSLLESAQANRLLGDSGISLFLLHQSVELIFRALILCLSGTEVREHSIAVLRKHLRRCAPAVCRFFPGDTEEEKTLLSLLDSAYCKGRYENGFAPGKEMLDTLFKRVDKLPGLADACFTSVFNTLIQNPDNESPR